MKNSITRMAEALLTEIRKQADNPTNHRAPFPIDNYGLTKIVIDGDLNLTALAQAALNHQEQQPLADISTYDQRRYLNTITGHITNLPNETE